MHKPTLKEVKKLKEWGFRSILSRMNSAKGNLFVAKKRTCRKINSESSVFVVMTFTANSFAVSSQDDYGWDEVNVPVWYHAGIDDGVSHLKMTRVALASEEAKRRIRDLFPGHERFVTWAYYRNAYPDSLDKRC